MLDDTLNSTYIINFACLFMKLTPGLIKKTLQTLEGSLRIPNFSMTETKTGRFENTHLSLKWLAYINISLGELACPMALFRLSRVVCQCILHIG